MCVVNILTKAVEKTAPASSCPPGNEPLCASDGRSYSSECQMQRTALQKDRVLKKVHSGPCKTQGGSRNHGFLKKAGARF